MTTTGETLPLDMLIAATRIALEQRLEHESNAATLRPGISLALDTLRLCATLALGPVVTCTAEVTP